MGLLASILALSFVIFFHELGHFLVARFFGVRVEVFSLGFGTKLFSRRIGETEYALSAIPLGGYVKLFDGSKENPESTSLRSKHPIQKIAILLAGPLFNLILAFLIYAALFLAQGTSHYSKEPIIGGIDHSQPAASILRPGDKIKSLDSKPIESFSDLGRLLADYTKPSVPLVLERRDGEEIVTLTIDAPLGIHPVEKRPILGISPIVEMQSVSILAALGLALERTANAIYLLYDGIKQLVIGALGLENINSIIGIAKVSSQAFDTSFAFFLVVIAFISVNLGILNLLPLPILDGGQILFTCYEWLRGKELDPRAANLLAFVGLSLIAGLMCLGFYNDLRGIFAS